MIHSLIRWALISIMVIGCKRPSSGDSISNVSMTPVNTGELDQLWALAPQGATTGIVVSSRALAMAEHAWTDVATFVHSLPSLGRAWE